MKSYPPIAFPVGSPARARTVRASSMRVAAALLWDSRADVSETTVRDFRELCDELADTVVRFIDAEPIADPNPDGGAQRYAGDVPIDPEAITGDGIEIPRFVESRDVAPRPHVTTAGTGCWCQPGLIHVPDDDTGNSPEGAE